MNDEFAAKWIEVVDLVATAQDETLPKGAAIYTDKNGARWAAMLVTQSTAPPQATRSWVQNDDGDIKSSSSKSFAELIELWKDSGFSKPGTHYVQSNRHSSLKMMVFWSIGAE